MKGPARTQRNGTRASGTSGGCITGMPIPAHTRWTQKPTGPSPAVNCRPFRPRRFSVENQWQASLQAILSAITGSRRRRLFLDACGCLQHVAQAFHGILPTALAAYGAMSFEHVLPLGAYIEALSLHRAAFVSTSTVLVSSAAGLPRSPHNALPAGATMVTQYPVRE